MRSFLDIFAIRRRAAAVVLPSALALAIALAITTAMVAPAAASPVGSPMPFGAGTRSEARVSAAESAPASGNAPAAVQRIRVGIRDVPPLAFRDVDGNVAGYLVEFLEAVGRRSGLRFDYVSYLSTEALQQAAIEGEVDAALPLLQTPERAAHFAFTAPLATLSVAILARRGTPAPDAALSELAGVPVAVASQASMMRRALLQAQPAARPVSRRSDAEIVVAVATGEARYGLIERSRAVYTLRRLGLTSVADVGTAPWPYEVTMAIRGGLPPQVRQAVADAVAAVPPGERRELVARWLDPLAAPWHQRNGKVLLAALVGVGLVGVPAGLMAQRKLASGRRDLARVHDLLQRTAQAASVGGWELDLRTGALRLTAQTHAILGTDPSQPRPDLALTMQRYEPGSRKLAAATLERLRRGGPPEQLDLQVRRTSDEVIWVRATAQCRMIDGVVTQVFGTFQDIHAAKLEQLAREESERRYRTLADNVLDLITMHAEDGRATVVYATPSSMQITGFPSEALVGGSPFDRVDLDDLPAVHAFFAGLARGEAPDSIVYKFRREDGQWIWLETRAKTVLDDEGRIVDIVAVSRDVGERVRASEALGRSEGRHRHLAFHDALTGLPNRAALLERLSVAVTAPTGAATLLFVDLDGFKHINDARGHSAGDALLVELARRLRTALGEGPFLARFGGDEFVALLEDARGDEVVAQCAARLIEACAQPVMLAGGPAYLTASIGVARQPEHGRNPEALLAAADAAMYASKAAGRNTWRAFSPAIGQAIADRAGALHELRDALEHDRLELYYQPKVDLRSGACVGVEALLRRRTPDGVEGPERLIAAAEESGLIGRLGEWVVRTAAAQSRAWRREGITLPIAVNVSGLQLRDGAFVAFLAEQIRFDPQLPRFLQLELTETSLALASDSACEVFTEIRRLGLKLHIDDFGTGYSSLAYLPKLPMDALKIDRGFVAGMTRSQDSREIVLAILAVARALKLAVIAEGVETREQAEFLALHGCDQAQGYLYARPAPAAAAAVFAAQDHRHRGVAHQATA